MMDERKAVAGDLVHKEFVEVTPVSNWTNKTRTAWMKKRDKVLKHLSTFKKGHKQAVTHAGSCSWAPPTFLEQETSITDINLNVAEATRLQESIRTQTIQLQL